MYVCMYVHHAHLFSAPPPLLLPLQDTLLYYAALIKEANSISVELNKNVLFQFALLSHTPYSPVPLSIATSHDMDTMPGQADSSLSSAASVMCARDGDIPRPLVVVEVKDSKHGVTHLWSVDKLK